MLRSVTFDDPVRTLQQLPGVGTSDELRAELSVRGSPFRQVGLVLDEVKSRLLVHTVRGVEQTGSVALLNADLLDAATLTPGAGPQRFGNTVGAELGIRTRAGTARRLSRPRHGERDRRHRVRRGSDRVGSRDVHRRRAPQLCVVDRAAHRSRRERDVRVHRRTSQAGCAPRHATEPQRRRDGRDVGVRRARAAYQRRMRSISARTTPRWARWRGRRSSGRSGSSGSASPASPAAIATRIPMPCPSTAAPSTSGCRASIVEWAPTPSVSMDAAAQVQRFTSRGASVVYRPHDAPGDLGRGAPWHTDAGRRPRARALVTAAWADAWRRAARPTTSVDLETFVGGWAQAQVALSADLALTAAVSRHGQSPDVLQRFGPAGTADLAFETATLVDAGLGLAARRRGDWPSTSTTGARPTAWTRRSGSSGSRRTASSPVATRGRRGSTR